MKLALVIWNGRVGGAENLNVELAQRLLRLGAEVTVLFIGDPEPLGERLRDSGTPYVTLGLGRGRQILTSARRYGELAGRIGPNGTLLEERGLMCLALRAGGYRAPMVAVEHGSVLLDQRSRLSMKRVARALTRAAGGRAVDVEVAVSDFMLKRMRQGTHAKRSMRIHNGVDPSIYSPPEIGAEGDRVVIGVAGRLVPGKGIEELIRAAAAAAQQISVVVLIAGDGPERARLEALRDELSASSRVRFLGFVADMPGFWRRCDIAAIPSSRFVESFSMVTLEAMACARAVVAARNGAIPELMLDGVTGTLVPSGDVDAMSDALLAYAKSPDLRRAHGLAARTRAIEHFHIEDCARSYLELFRELTATAARVPSVRGERAGAR